MHIKKLASTLAGVATLLALPMAPANARPCSYIGDYPCTDKSKCIEHLKDSAEWVIEADVSGIENTGKQTECDEPLPDGGPNCVSVDSPEKINLVDVRVIRGDFATLEDKATVARKDICFSGPLADAMNSRPELRLIGERARFYGDNREVGRFSRSGFYYVELVK